MKENSKSKCFSSLREAAQFVKDRAKRNKQEVVEKSCHNGLCGRKGCKVLCKNTGKVYDSLSACAKELGIPQWTLSVKTQFAGKFIDKEGNEYIRETPMQQWTKRDYGNTSATLERRRHFKRKNVKSLLKDCTSSVEIPVNTPIKETTKEVVNTIVKKENNSLTLLKSVVKDLLENKNYTEATKIIDVISTLDK